MIAPDAKKHARAKGQEDNSKDPKLQDFLHVMQPRAKSKLWENDTAVVSNDGNNQAALNKETDGTSIANHPILSDTKVVGLPNNPDSDKSRELMTDLDYFKSRVITEWSDSVSSNDENDNDNSDDDKDNRSHGSEREEDCGNNPSERNPRSGAQELDLEGQEDTFGEDVANDKFQVSATEDKKEVYESCRLFARNLPYTTTYFLKFSYGSMFHIVFPAFPFSIFLQNECLMVANILR